MGNEVKEKIIPFPPSTERNVNPKKKEIQFQGKELCSKTRKILLISSIVLAILITVIVLFVLFVYPCTKCTNIQEDDVLEILETDSSSEQKDPPKNDIEDLGPIEAEFEISTKVNDLTRIYVNQKSYENITTNGKSTQILIDRKTNYDIYIISSTPADENTKNFYNETYLCSIAIASECVSTDDEYCLPQKLVDFSDQDYSHERNLEEVEDLEDIPVPLCLFNLTNNNVITSMICHKSLSPTKKYTMILDLYFFRPPSIKRPDKERTNNIIDFEHLENNQTLIKEKNAGICDVENFINSYCTTEMNTTINSNNKILKYNEIAFTNITTDENNTYIKNKTTILIDESNKTESLNSEKYNETLFKILSKLEPFMQYDEHFSDEQFKELYLVSKNASKPKERRRLNNNRNNVVYSDNLFYFEHYGGVILNIDLKDNTGIGSENIEALLDLKIDDENKNLVQLKEFTNIDHIINKLILLSKAGNNLATNLYEKVNEYLNNLTDFMNNNITSLNKYLFYKDFTNIFDSTLSLHNIKNLNHTIIDYSDKLVKQLDKIYIEIDNGSLKKKASLLNKNIYNFIKDSHKIINNIFNNLRELGSKLNSKKNRITEISTYYLNYTSTSYITIIKEAQNVLMNYYKKENELIIPQVNKIIEKFEEMVINSIEKQKNLINNLYTNLKNNNYNIENANIEEYNKTITNLYNSEKYISAIINLVKEKIKKEMELKDGHFISASDIKSNNETYSKFIEEALIIAQKLDNDEFIDKTFDEIMINFRDNFTSIVKYMNKIKEEKFPLNDDTLKDSFFTESIKQNITNQLKDNAVEIINKIKNENKYYLDKIDEKVGKFLKENKENLTNLINELEVLLTKDYFEKLENYFDKALKSCFDKIENTFKSNEILTKDYFNNLCGIAKDNNKIIDLLKNFHVDDAHLPQIIPIDRPDHYLYFTSFYDLISSKAKTTGYIKKYNNIKSIFDYSNKFVQETMPREFLNKYQDVITKIKELLQSVRNNKITELYPDYSDLFFINDNLKIIDNAYNILNNVLSDKKFNNKFLPRINTFKTNEKKKIQILDNFIEDNHKIINTQTTQNDNTNDFCISFLRKKTYTCTNGAISHCENSDYYCLPLSDKSNNYKKLIKPEIDSDKNLKEFIEEFEEYYKKISNKVNYYNEKITELKEIISSIQKETLEKKITLNYLLEIKEDTNNILSLKYGDELIKASYDYYKKNSEEKMENVLNDISEKWKDSFNILERDITENMTKFKNSISEYGIMALVYETVITNNITRKYFESIINHQKNEFNYTISNYYNFFIKEVNSIYQYVFNKIPTNKRGFNNIINQRKNEVKDIFNTIINTINESKKEAISIGRQKYILEKSESNFFGLNKILSDNIDSSSSFLKNIAYNIYELSNGKSNDEESFTSKFYLENSENGKQIEKLYEEINDNLFIELNLENFKELLVKNWIFDKNEFINNLNSTLENYNLEIKNEYLVIEEELKKDLEGEINKHFTKEQIYNGINNFYTTQIKEFDETMLSQINNYIKEILKVIKINLSNESEKIKSTMSFYTTDFSKIENTLKSIKETIYNKIRNTLVNIISEFHENLINKFYINYIANGLEKYIEMANNYNIPTEEEYDLLSSSYNIHNITINLVEELVEDYKNKTKMKIDDQYEEFLNIKSKEMKLDEIKKKISDEIDNEYKSNLLESLKEYAKFTPGESDYEEYDLNTTIKNNINTSINSNVENINNIMLKIKGDKFTVDLYGWDPCDFEDNEIIKNVYNKFSLFINPQIENEKNNLNEFLKKVINDNFNNSLNIIIQSFGNEFFERIIKYNENYKIISLYDNLKYSLVISLQYYLMLYDFKDVEALTKDLKLKLYNLNNLDLVAEKKNKQVLDALNEKVIEFIEQSKKNIINTYFSFIRNDETIENSFNSVIVQKIKENLEGVRNNLEKEYTNLLNIYLKENIVLSFSEIMNEKTSEMIQTVDEQKELIKLYIDGLFTLAPEEILDEINNKLNNTLGLINQYSDNFKNFKISDELIEYLNDFGESFILPAFEDIYSFINNLIKKYIFLNLDENSGNYENDYKNDFLNITENIKSIIKTYFIGMNNEINNYGETENQYDINLENKIGYFDKRRRRRLNNEQTDEDNFEEYKQKIADKAIDETFYKLLNNSKNTKRFINSFEEFKNIGENISKTFLKLNTSYKKSEKIIKDNNFEEEVNNKFFDKLKYLKDMTTIYYNTINETFLYISDYIKESMNKIDHLLNQCANITYSTFIKKYEEISNETEFINSEHSKEEVEVNKISHDSISQNTNFTTDIFITSLVNKAKFKFRLDFEEDGEIKKPKVMASIINECKPKKIKFLVYSGYGNCGKFVQRIIADFDGVNYTTNINFNTESTQINATIETNFDKYKYSKEKYEIKDAGGTNCRMVLGVPLCITQDKCDEKKENVLEAKEDVIVEKKNYILEKYIDD